MVEVVGGVEYCGIGVAMVGFGIWKGVMTGV